MTLHSYYWDSSVFITVLSGSIAYGQAPLEAANEILRMTQRGEAVLISSEIVTVEILPLGKSPEMEVYERFDAMRQWPHLVIRAVDHGVARRAAKLRTLCLSHTPKMSLKTPDAIHLATAHIYNADVKALHVHSFDPDFSSANAALGNPLNVSWPQLEEPTDSLFANSGLGPKL